MALYHLVYVSSAVRAFAPADLVTLLEQSRRNNSAVGITGMLLYRDGNFMQVLEGEEAEVSRTHERIVADPRHVGLLTLLKGPIPQRGFGDWSMGFRDLGSPDLRGVAGYNEFMNEDWRGKPMQESPHRALKLLHSFRASMR